MTFTKAMKIVGNNSVFTKTVTVNEAEIEINNVTLTAPGASASETVPAIKVYGTQPFTLKNSTVGGSSRTAINIMTSGKITLDGNTFNAGDSAIYNMIEFSISNARDIENVSIINNTFVGTLKNNAISLYNLAEGAEIEISGNDFNLTVNNNAVRLSNPKNVSANFILENNTYSFTTDTAGDYTGFMLLQDYSKTDVAQDFSKFNISFKNLSRSGKVLTEKGSGLDRVFYVYQDTKGILADGENDPTVTFAA